MTPEAVRVAWIAGLAAAGAAVVGAVAYASKSSAAASSLPVATANIPGKFSVAPGPHFTPQGQITTPGAPPPPPPWKPPPPPPFSQVLTMSYLGQTGLSAQATVGQTLYVEVPPGVSVTTASIMADPMSGQGPPGNGPTYVPNQTSLYGNGGAISVVMNGAPGYLIISGIDVEGQTSTTTIPIGSPSSPTLLPGGV
jgi:hypothetical protein